MPDDKAVPTITLKVTDFEKFNVEIDFQTSSLEYARLMLNTATQKIEQMIRDAEALEFGAKMQRGAMAHAAMQKGPRRII